MAFTRVRGPGITTDDNYRVGVITATKFVGPIETTTDSDFTNISVSGIGTIDGVKIGDPAGIVTSTTPAGIVTYYGDASKLTGLTAGQIPNLDAAKITSGTVATARLGSGTANNGVFLRGDQSWQAVPPGTTINSNTNNYLITGTGTANTLQGEANIICDGDSIVVTQGSSNIGFEVHSTGSGRGAQTKYHNDHSVGCYIGVSGNTTGDMMVYNEANTATRFYTNSAERLVITAAGALQVNGGAVHLDANGELAVFETDTNLAFTNSSKLCFDFSSNIARIRSSVNGSATVRDIGIYTANDERLRITSAGLVGINQNTPTERLHVVGNAIVTGMIKAGDGTTSNCAYANNGDSHTGMYFPFNDTLAFSTGGTQRLYVGGNVVIGNPTSHNYYSSDLLLNCPNNAGGMTIIAGSTSHSNFINFADAASSPGYLAGGIKYRHDTDAFIIRAGHEEKVEVQTGGDLKINDGNLVIGTSGHGISFAATSDASGMWGEVLDDYEYGNFTPVTYGWGTATPYGGSNYNNGWYVKIGHIVHVGWKIYYNGLSGANSHIGVGGFPFNSGGNQPAIAAARFDVPETSVTYDLIFYLGGGDNKVWLYQKTSSGALGAINSSGNRSNVWTMGTVTYYT